MYKQGVKKIIAIITMAILIFSISACKSKNDTSTSSNVSTYANHFSFYPSGEDFIRSILDERGNVKISTKIRELFNLYARDYCLAYLPDMNYYESFFDADQYAKSFGYNNFGYAVAYVLSYMRYPEKMSSESMQIAIQDLFVAKNPYKDMPHRTYQKLANYENGYYSPWPEGGLDNARMFYLLTGLNIVQKGGTDLYITFRAKSYYFNDSGYEPGVNEKWLAEKSKELGISDMQAAARLVTNGEIEELKGDREYKSTIHIKFAGQNPYGLDPRFVSNLSFDILKDNSYQ